MNPIEQSKGNLLAADVEALVNTVNTVGVMGKGIALQFKKAYPENYRAYRKACERGEVRPGRMFVFETGSLTGPRWIINFPTKRHWRAKTKIEDIDEGLADLVSVIREKRIRSIAVPPLGCGNGGLSWSAVRPMIESSLASLDDVRVLLFAPSVPPDPRTQKVEPVKRRMTPARAAFLLAIDAYRADPTVNVTRLVVQKLAYFLQATGAPLKLKFVKGQYGPYAEAVNFVLQDMEGAYIRGYGDRTTASNIEVEPKAVHRARSYLADDTEMSSRVGRIKDLIAGFESPFGLELLATVHWAAASGNATSPASAQTYVGEWNERKRAVFTDQHVMIAWQRLDEQGWLFGPTPTSAPPAY